MFVAFHAATYFILCCCVSLYFILNIGVVRYLNLNSNQKSLIL
jgi:hypothetical protein